MNATPPLTPRCPQCNTPLPATPDVPYTHHDGLDGLARCRTCDLVSLLPMPTPEQVEEYYSGDGNWELLSSDEVAIPNRRRRAAIEARHAGAPGSVYDIGASHGAFLEEMQRAGWRVSGLEPSPRDAKITSERLGQPIDNEFFGPDTQAREQYDVVTCWDVLEHMINPAACLEAMMRFVKPGGLLVIAIPHIDGKPAELLGERWRYTVPPWHIHFFGLRWLQEQAAANNAEILGIDGFAKVHAWAEALVPRSMQQAVIDTIPNRKSASDAPTQRTGLKAHVRRAVRRAVLQVNQTEVPLPMADLIDVTFRTRLDG